MQIYLSYRQPELGAAWAERFIGTEGVIVTKNDIIDLGVDAIVSPANSFGFMDGGLDYQISERLGWHIQERVQSLIRRRPLGELLIGEAIVVPTDDARTPWLISAPTMRVPMQIPESLNAYLAMKAILIAIQNHTDEIPIRSVAIPGLGTGIGRLDPRIAASQMWSAYDEIINRNRVFPPSFGDAQRMYRKLNPDARLSR
jgi:O-acetyl-ADP-ribose deacetylase (regulator of RNase III)